MAIKRPADLVHRLVRGLRRRHSPFEIALDILDDDDRIVDHDTHRQHQAEQGQIVQGDPERRENGEGADQGHRDRDHRDQRGAPALQEDEHHEDDEQDRLEDRVDDLIDRFADEDRGIVDDLVAQARREVLRQRRDGRKDLVLDRQRVCPRLREDQQRHARTAVHEAGRTIVRGADLDPADVADAGDPSLVVGLHDDVGELLGRRQPAERLHVDLVGLGRSCRWLVQDAGGDLEVLSPQRREHLAGTYVPGRDLVRIEPDPHGIFACAHKLHVTDTRQPRQRILHMQRRVVRHVEGVARAVRRVEVDGQQNVRRRLADLHAQPLHVFGQPRQRVLDAILRQHLGDVQVGADPEGHRDGELAVAGRLAAHVEHALDAVDLLLERRGHGACHGLGRGARIDGRDLHRRRHDLRVLCDWQDGERAEPDQGHEHAEDGREDRPVDEEVRQAHGGVPS